MTMDQLFHSLVETTNDIVLVTDNDFKNGGPHIVYVNPAFESKMGYRAEEVIGQSAALLTGPNTDKQARYRINRALRKGKGIRTELQKYSKDGKAHWLDMNIIPLENEPGEIQYFASIERDISRYKKMERQLAKMALFDSLTGSLNRAAFMQHAQKEFARAKRYHRPLSVVMIDIDFFKRVNDKYGHAAGDHVLQIFVEAIEEEIRNTDILGRVGGEEFALLLPDTPLLSASHLAERVRERITKYPYLAGDQLIEVTASLGVALLSDEDEHFKEMLHRADNALYTAKHDGRNQVKLAA